MQPAVSTSGRDGGALSKTETRDQILNTQYITLNLRDIMFRAGLLNMTFEMTQYLITSCNSMPPIILISEIIWILWLQTLKDTAVTIVPVSLSLLLMGCFRFAHYPFQLPM